MERKDNAKHVQTLVGMNHCVSIARRDAAYQCLMAFTSSTKDLLRDKQVTQRLEGYRRCGELLSEAMTATQHATISNERHGVMDRPAVHILKLLSAFVSAVTSLANHVYMVEETAEVLSEPLGQETYNLLVNTCRDFGSTECEARTSFLHILDVGRVLLESSTSAHKEHFSEDEHRRYKLAFDEYTRLYSDENYEFSARLRPLIGQ